MANPSGKRASRRGPLLCMWRSGRSGRMGRIARFAALGLLLALAMASVAASPFMWPRGSRQAVAPLAQPTLESKLAAFTPGPEAGYTFAAFGDQRALAGGEWESMMTSIDSLSQLDPRMLFLLDTGDIVESGFYRDQFRTLASILTRAPSLPYLVGVGNHELDNDRPGPSRLHTAAFLEPAGASINILIG